MLFGERFSHFSLFHALLSIFPKKKPLQKTPLKKKTGITTLLAAIAVLLWISENIAMVGNIAALCNVIMMIAPMLKLLQVLETGDTEALGSAAMALCGLLCSVAWFLMGWFYLGNVQGKRG